MKRVPDRNLIPGRKYRFFSDSTAMWIFVKNEDNNLYFKRTIEDDSGELVCTPYNPNDFSYYFDEDNLEFKFKFGK